MNKTFRIWFVFSYSDNRKSKPVQSIVEGSKIENLVGIVALVVTFARCGVVAEAQQSPKIPG
jgi:hypothetical protein